MTIFVSYTAILALLLAAGQVIFSDAANPYQSPEKLSQQPSPLENEASLFLIVKFKDGESWQNYLSVAEEDGVIVYAKVRTSHVLGIKGDEVTMAELRENPNVVRVTLDSPLYGSAGSAKPTTTHENKSDDGNDTNSTGSRRDLQGSCSTPPQNLWGLEWVEGDQLPASGRRWKPTICVIGGGYRETHEDLPKQDLHGVTGWTPNDPDYGSWNTEVPGENDGTIMAGVMGAIGTNSVGITSMNPNPNDFRFFVAKVLRDTDGSGQVGTVFEAMEECVFNQGANVVAIGVTWSGTPAMIEWEIFRLMFDFGVLFVSTPGRGPPGDVREYVLPASLPPVISVSPIAEGGVAMVGSIRNSQIELSAPGQNVWSTDSTLDDCYKTDSGGFTSPVGFVAGVAAALWSYFPQCTASQIRQAMILTAEEDVEFTFFGDDEFEGCDVSYGNGYVKAKKAYDLLATSGCRGAGKPMEGVLDGCQNGAGIIPDCSEGVVVFLAFILGTNPQHVSLQFLDITTNTVLETLNGFSSVDENRPWSKYYCVEENHDYRVTLQFSSTQEVFDGSVSVELDGEEVGLLDEEEFEAPSSTITFTTSGEVLPPPSPGPTPDLPSGTCGNGSKLLSITIMTDSFGREVSLGVLSIDGETRHYNARDFGDNVEVGPMEVCLSTEEEPFAFVIWDSGENGFCCEFGDGWYKVEYDGEVIANRFASFTNIEVLLIPEDATIPPNPAPAPTSSPVVDSPPSTTPPKNPEACDDGSRLLAISLETDLFGDEVTVLVFSNVTQEVFFRKDDFPDSSEVGPMTVCLPDSEGPFVLGFLDSGNNGFCCEFGDGWFKVEYDGVFLLQEFAIFENVLGIYLPAPSPPSSCRPKKRKCKSTDDCCEDLLCVRKKRNTGEYKKKGRCRPIVIG